MAENPNALVVHKKKNEIFKEVIPHYSDDATASNTCQEQSTFTVQRFRIKILVFV